MATVKTRDEVIDTLVGRGVTRDRATMYAAAYATFHEADANITANGAVVAHPHGRAVGKSVFADSGQGAGGAETHV